MTDPDNVVPGPWGRRSAPDDSARPVPSTRPATDGPQVFETSHGILSFHEVTDDMIAASFAPDTDEDRG